MWIVDLSLLGVYNRTLLAPSHINNNGFMCYNSNNNSL